MSLESLRRSQPDTLARLLGARLNYQVLEERQAFDGALPATVDAAADGHGENGETDASSDPPSDTSDRSQHSDPSTDDLVAALSATYAEAAGELPRRTEIVFVDSGVEDYQHLLADITANSDDGRQLEVVVLDHDEDGVARMASELSGRDDIDAIHIIAEGNAAELHLGSTFLTSQAINSTYAEAFEQIGQSLTGEADILIYGCNFGAGDAGFAAMRSLAELTGADIAASNDRTGHVAQFGDWVLEVSTGSIETTLAVSAYGQASWHGALATFTVTNTNDTGVGSLRQAILDANASAGSDSIHFVISDPLVGGAHTISLTSALPVISETVTIDATTEPDYSGAPVVMLDGTAAGIASHGLIVDGVGTTIRGLSIGAFDATAITVTADNVTIVGNYIGLAPDGITARANGGGITVLEAADARIGGLTSGDRNVISGNTGTGVALIGSGAIGNVVRGNYIGTDATGTSAIGNTLDGVHVTAGASSNIIGGTVSGAGNLIFGNGGAGISIDASSNSNSLLGNAVYSNGQLAIDLEADGVTANDALDGDAGANDLQNFPVLTSAVTEGDGKITVLGSLNSSANDYFRIEFFASATQDVSGHGEAQRYLGHVNVATDGSGNADFEAILGATVAAGEYITATATNSDAAYVAFTDTSELAQNVTVTDINIAPTFAVGDGSVITAITPQFDAAYDIIIQPDGKYLVLSEVDTAAVGTDVNIALSRFNSDGSLDTSFGTGGTVITPITADQELAGGVALQEDGKIVVAGGYSPVATLDTIVLRYNADGTLDTSFDGDGMFDLPFTATGYDYFTDVAVQPDGKIVAFGSADFSGNVEIIGVRLNSDGSLDPSFDGDGIRMVSLPNIVNFATAFELQSDGRIVIVGWTYDGSQRDIFALRLNDDASLDTSFGTGGVQYIEVGSVFSLPPQDDYAYDVAIDAQGRIVIGGETETGSTNEILAVRLNADGSLDGSFGTNGVVQIDVGPSIEIIHKVAIQNDGKIVLAGSVYDGSLFDVLLVRLNDDGSMDTSFDVDGIIRDDINGGDEYALALAIDVDGSIVVAGNTTVGSDHDILVARYNSDGSVDKRFDPINTLDGNPTFVEDGPAVVLDADVQIFDYELSALDNFNGASLTVSRAAGANPEDVFTATGSLAPLTEGGVLQVGATVIGMVTTNSAGTLVLAFNANATNALVNQAMRQIAYRNDSDVPPASVQINWTFDDGNSGAQGTGGSQQATGSVFVNITAVNDPPLVDLNDDGTTTSRTFATSFSGGAPISITDTDATVFDPEGNITVLDVSIANTDQDGANEIVTIGGLALPYGTVQNAVVIVGGTNFLLQYDGDSSLRVTNNADPGGPMPNADLTALIRSATYVNTHGNPTVGHRFIHFQATDSEAQTSSTATAQVAVLSPNSAPIVAADTAVVQPLQPINIDVLANDSDPDGDPLTIDGIYDPANPGVLVPLAIGSPVTLATGTTVERLADNTLEITQSAGILEQETFSYQVSDGQGGVDTGVVTLNTDTDGDGVINAQDIDDDNDGIVDSVEGISNGTTDLIADPSFSIGMVDTADFYTAVDGSTSFAINTEFVGNWSTTGTVDWSQGQYVAVSTAAAASVYPAMIDVSPAGGGMVLLSVAGESLSNAMPTIVGEIYQVSFYLGSLPMYSDADGSLTDYAPDFTYAVAGAEKLDGSPAVFTEADLPNTYLASDFPSVITNTDPGGYTALDPHWQLITFEFRATGSSSVLSLQMHNTTSVVTLDDVRVTLTSNPAVLRATDGGSLYSHIDIDSDNDGITDNVEAQSTAGYIAPSGLDSDGDGLDDAYDQAVGIAGSLGLTPIDTDASLGTADGIADYLDTDSDNDGQTDAEEAGHGILQAAIDASGDSDGDGLKDVVDAFAGFDVNDDNLDPTNTNFNLADSDNDTLPDGSDAVPLNHDLDYRDVNRPPIATPNSFSVTEDDLLTSNLITVDTGAGIDTDPDGDPFTLTQINGASYTPGQAITLASGARLTAQTDGTFVYDPNGAFDGLAAGASAIDTFTYQISDGNDGFDTATVTITITGLNDSPTIGSATLAAVSEDDTDPPGATISSLIGASFSDPDAGASLSGIVVTSNNAPLSEGVWQYSTDAGTTWFAIGSVGVNGLGLSAGSYIRFLPASDYHGTPTLISIRGLDNTYAGGFSNGASRVMINTSSPGGGSAISAGLQNISTSVTAVEDAPLVDLNDDGTTSGRDYAAVFTEGSLPVAVADTNAVVFDVESNITHLDVTIAGTDADGASELVRFATATISNGTPASGTVVVGGTTFAYAYDGGSGLSFNNVAGAGIAIPNADLTALIRTLTYENTSQNPTAGDRTFSFIVRDAGALVSTTAVSTITVEPVNDVPVATGGAVSVSEDTALLFTAGDFGFTDVEGDALASVTLTNLNLAGGTLTHSGGIVAVTDGMTVTAAELAGLTYVPAANYHGPAGFDFTVNDAGAGTIAAAMAITVEPVNDVPVATGGAVSVSEDTALLFTAGDFGFTDVEGDALASVTLTNLNLAGGTLTHSGGTVAVTDGMTVTAAELAGLTYVPAANYHGPAGFDFTVNDAGAGTIAAAMAITVEPVNDVPVATGGAVSVSEDTALLFTAGDFGFTDVEGDALASVTLTNLNLAGGTLTHSGGTVAVTDGMTVTAAELAGLTYVPAANYHGPAGFDFTVNDAGAGTIAAAMAITVEPVNDRPQITALSLTIDEGMTVALGTDEIAVADSDHGPVDLIFTVSAQRNGQFEFVAAPGTAILSFTQADIVAGLVQFVHDGGEDPPTYDLTVTDGSLTDGPTTVQVTFTNAQDQGVVVSETQRPTAPSFTGPETQQQDREESETAGTSNEAPSATGFVDPSLEKARGPINPGAVKLANFAMLANDPQHTDNGSTGRHVDEREADETAARRLEDRQFRPGPASYFGLPANLNMQRFTQSLDSEISNFRQSSQYLDSVVGKITLGVGMTLTVGYISWLVRVGVFASALLATVPVWGRFDPLIVLTSDDEDDAQVGDDESKAESLFVTHQSTEGVVR